MGDRVLHIKEQKERSPQNMESKANNTGGDATKILNVCPRTRTNKKACDLHRRPMTSNSDSEFEVIRSVSCDTSPPSPSIN
ncbi:MAG: hypothetical protein IK999_09475 [Ruminococcus sp.]|nr:hypothetical protein [Ruminococcus sp.]